MTKKELEERLINFSVEMISFCQKLPNSREGNYLAGQMIRSAISCTLNFGEALDAESKKNLIHKNKIIKNKFNQ